MKPLCISTITIHWFISSTNIYSWSCARHCPEHWYTLVSPMDKVPCEVSLREANNNKSWTSKQENSRNTEDCEENKKGEWDRQWLRGVDRKAAFMRETGYGLSEGEPSAETEYGRKKEKNVPEKNNQKWRGLRQEQVTLEYSKAGPLIWGRSKSRQGPDHTGMCSMFWTFPKQNEEVFQKVVRRKTWLTHCGKKIPLYNVVNSETG